LVNTHLQPTTESRQFEYR